MKTTKTIMILLAITITLIAAGCTKQTSDNAISQEQPEAELKEIVKLRDNKFLPTTTVVKVGTTVTWINEDQIPHVVKSTDGVFESTSLQQADTWSYKFENTGIYNYASADHPEISARIKVE